MLAFCVSNDSVTETQQSASLDGIVHFKAGYVALLVKNNETQRSYQQSVTCGPENFSISLFLSKQHYLKPEVKSLFYVFTHCK